MIPSDERRPRKRWRQTALRSPADREIVRQRRRLWSLAMLVAALACARTTPPEETPGTGAITQHEASMNFDLKNLGPFLHQVAARYEGVSADDVDDILSAVAAMPVESERSWEYTLTSTGEPTTLRIVIFLDDVDAPDLFLFSSEAIADELREALLAYAEQLGT